MSTKAIDQLKKHETDSIVEVTSFRGDESVYVKAANWVKVANVLKHNDAMLFDQFVDLTAVDYPEREPEAPRFELVLRLRSTKNRWRICLKTKIKDQEEALSLCEIWGGTNWAEREIYDMFGIRFKGHPDLRRILMYEEFEGYPLRKDYPIDRAQPLVEYRPESVQKQMPFGIEQGQPFGRIRWDKRLQGGNQQVSPSIAVQSGQKRTLSDSAYALQAAEKMEQTPSSNEVTE